MINHQKYVKKDPKGQHYIVENSSEAPDIPNGDCFRAVSSYSLSSAGAGKSRLIVTGAVNFHKSSWIKGFIESHAIEGMLQYLRDLDKNIEDTISASSPSPLASPPTMESPSKTSSPTVVSPTVGSPSKTASPTAGSPSKASPLQKLQEPQEPDKPSSRFLVIL